VSAPPASHERKFIYRATPRPQPENCTTGHFALPLLHQHHRFARLGQEGPHQTCRDNYDNDGGRTARPPGPREESYGFGRRNRRALFFTFVSLVRLVPLVAQAEGATELAHGLQTGNRLKVPQSTSRLKKKKKKKKKKSMNPPHQQQHSTPWRTWARTRCGRADATRDEGPKDSNRYDE